MHHSTSHQGKLDLDGSVYCSWQQIQLNIHICMIRRYCYRHNYSHKHLGISIHQNLQRLQFTKVILW